MTVTIKLIIINYNSSQMSAISKKKHRQHQTNTQHYTNCTEIRMQFLREVKSVGRIKE